MHVSSEQLSNNHKLCGLIRQDHEVGDLIVLAKLSIVDLDHLPWNLTLLQNVTAALVTDAKSSHDVVRKDDLNSAAGGLREKYSALELLSLNERLRRGETTIRWVNSDAQVADALTKPARPGALHQLMTTGSWKLVYDPTITSAKRLKQRTH